MCSTTIYFEMPDPGRITLPIKNGFSYLKQKEIVWCKSENTSSTRVYLTDGSCLEALWPITFLESCLPRLHFYRVHPLYLVNIDHVAQWIKNEDNYLIMTGGVKLPFFPNMRRDFITKLQSAISVSIPQ